MARKSDATRMSTVRVWAPLLKALDDLKSDPAHIEWVRNTPFWRYGGKATVNVPTCNTVIAYMLSEGFGISPMQSDMMAYKEHEQSRMQTAARYFFSELNIGESCLETPTHDFYNALKAYESRTGRKFETPETVGLSENPATGVSGFWIKVTRIA